MEASAIAIAADNRHHLLLRINQVLMTAQWCSLPAKLNSKFQTEYGARNERARHKK